MPPRWLTRSRKDRKSTRLNSSHDQISYAVFCLKKKKKHNKTTFPTLSHNQKSYAIYYLKAQSRQAVAEQIPKTDLVVRYAIRTAVTWCGTLISSPSVRLL